MSRLRPILTVFAAVAIAIVVELFLPLEWTTARCGIGETDQPYAAYGVPLPYMMWSGVSSLEYDYVPWALGTNLLLIAAGLFVVLRKFGRMESGWHLVWSVPVAILGGWLLQVPLSFPVGALGYGEAIHLSEFRPITDKMGGIYDCTPSRYWFPDAKDA